MAWEKTKSTRRYWIGDKPIFEIGDMVGIRKEPKSNRYNHTTRKLTRCYEGPCTIIGKIGENDFLIKDKYNIPEKAENQNSIESRDLIKSPEIMEVTPTDRLLEIESVDMKVAEINQRKK